MTNLPKKLALTIGLLAIGPFFCLAYAGAMGAQGLWLAGGELVEWLRGVWEKRQ